MTASECEDPRRDPVALSKRLDVTPTTEVRPGDWAVVDGRVEVADPDARPGPIASGLSPPEDPVPSGDHPGDAESPYPDPLWSFTGDVEEAVSVLYAIEGIQTIQMTSYAPADNSFRYQRLYHGVESSPFRIADDVGSVRVEPSASLSTQIHDLQTRIYTERGWSDDAVEVGATHYSLGSFPVVDSATEDDTAGGGATALFEHLFGAEAEEHTLRYREGTVRPGDAALVLGWVTERDGETVITAPEAGGTFLVSARRR